jgi:carboxypeptidase Taq
VTAEAARARSSEAGGAAAIVEVMRPLLGEIWDLSHAAAVLVWDQHTMMPPGGVEGRAQQLATLRRLSHERLTAPVLGELLENLESATRELPDESFERSLARVLRRDRDDAIRIPAELVDEMARASAAALPVWVQARSESDWKIFAPAMRTTVELARRQADALSDGGDPYDALLRLRDPGVTAGQMLSIFAELRSAIVPLVRRIAERRELVDDLVLRRDYDEPAQLTVALQVVERLGYDLRRGRQDLAPHPFCISFGAGDVRITTRTQRDWLPACLYGSIHESGHAMYNQGIPAELQRTPLWAGASSGVHESQSRLWENLVGRGRPFSAFVLPMLRSAFPGRLDDVDAEQLYRAVNRVDPSYIRVEADEVTYNLHVMLRFELETALLDGSLAVEDVPEAWNSRVAEYLGLPAPSDAEGALQDIHWTFPTLGGFVGYTLGNLIGAQLMGTVRAALPGLDVQVESGNFAPLLGWLQENVYRHGRKFTPNELVERITGEELSATPWINYVERKFKELYG